MASNVVNAIHASLPVKAQNTARAHLRKAKTRTDADLRKSEIEAEEMARIGSAIEAARLLARMTLDQFAREINRNPRQVSAWIHGKERPHFDAMFAVEKLQQPLVIALAGLAKRGVVVDTVIHLREEKSA